MRLLHIHGAAQLAGCERTCEMFMRELEQVEHHVLVLGQDGPAVKVWSSAGATVRVLQNVPGRIEEFSTVLRAVREASPDGVILWSPSRLGLKVAACTNGGCKKVIAHIGNPIRLSFRNAVAAEFYTALPGSRRATLIPVSRHVERSFQARSGFRHFPSHPVYNAIDINQFPYLPLAELPGRIRVGMVARLDPIKDHATLLHAWSVVLRERPDWVLELAGDGPLRGELERLARGLGIESRVRFLGWAANIPQIMLGWSMVAHSTTREEGLGNSMLEAMALGRALVATAIGPVLEITENGRVARLSEERDAAGLARQILDVQQNWEQSKLQVAAAREMLDRRFAPEKMVREYVRCLGLESAQ